MDIVELIPQESGFCKNPTLSENQEMVFTFIQDAVFAVEIAYSSVASPSVRNKIRAYMCDKALLQAESAIEKQYKLALAGDQIAAENVKSGMDYWKKLVINHICNAMEVV